MRAVFSSSTSLSPCSNGSTNGKFINPYKVTHLLSATDEQKWAILNSNLKCGRYCSMAVDRKKFYDEQHFRKYFQKVLSQPQVNSYEAIFDYWESKELSDLRWLAYILATAYHEVSQQMQPVREGFCKTDECSIAAVKSLGLDYWKPEPATGKSYFGRGFVQLTHASNYKRMGQKLNIDLYHNPDLALNLQIAVQILIEGMVDGEFTGKKLKDFFNDSKTDWDDARDIVNPGERGRRRALVSEFGRDFYACLT